MIELLIMSICIPITMDCGYTVTIEDNLPPPCQLPDVIACTINYKDMYFTPYSIGLIDKWGNTSLWHEIKHILCRCNWHENMV